MFRKQRQCTYGAWHINTAQAIIFLIAIGCVGVVFNAYQQAHEPPPSFTLPDASAQLNPRRTQYAAQIKIWQKKMEAQQTPVTWPYLGQDNVVRVDLPSLVPVTLADWSDDGIKGVAKKAYNSFVSVRKKAHVGSPEACIVDVFASDGQQVIQESASGPTTVQSPTFGGG